MERVVQPVEGPLDAVVSVPGSKSIANRALLCAALADGPCVIDNVPDGDDTVAMLDCLARLGIDVTREVDRVHVTGRGGALDEGPIVLPARLAGTTSRFLTALCALGVGPYVIDGELPLRARPMAGLHNALMAIGAQVVPLERPGHLPVQVRRSDVGTFESRVEVRGDISSQYISALMMIAPYLPNGLEIALTTDLVSRPYIEMTRRVMEAFGVGDVVFHDHGFGSITVPAGRYRSTTFSIEADASSASYPLAAAAIVGGSVRVKGLFENSTQSDIRFVEALGAMGCAVEQEADGLRVSCSDPLRGITVDMRDFSDTAPTLAVVAAFASSTTRITGIGFIRGKESDRIGDVVHELRACGVHAEAESDGIVVHPGQVHAARVATHHDHRIAMSFALIGLCRAGVVIEDPDVVSKSFPGYWKLLDQLSRRGGVSS